jgi:hypothetical protein
VKRLTGAVLALWGGWCARAPGLISVRDPAVRRAGDMMVDGGKRRDETGMEMEMRVLYIEGVAIHGGPESCVGVP